MKKIISFSLWGDNPKYTIGAVHNADLAKRYYPGWICRFYVGQSVPYLFHYGITSYKAKWWRRIIIAWKYLVSGKMFADQLTLNPNEAKKLADFINENLIQAE